MAGTRSALSINITFSKISIRKTNKIQQRRSRISNPKLKSLFEIHEDSMNCLTMQSVWGSLKAYTQAHSELDIRPCRREVQEEANHAHVLPLIDRLTIFIGIQCCRRTHWSCHWLSISLDKLLDQILRVLGLMYKCALLCLLDLDT
jgi:hypothetical protein